MIFTEEQTIKLYQRLLEKRLINENGCWEWTGARGRHGYGNISFYGKTYKVHRLAFAIYQSDPGTLAVCHKCDYPPCFNPGHLFKGTLKDNQADSKLKGRMRHGRVYGNSHGRAILTDEIVLKIRDLYRSRIATVESLAKQYKVSCGCIDKALRGDTWKHLKSKGD